MVMARFEAADHARASALAVDGHLISQFSIAELLSPAGRAFPALSVGREVPFETRAVPSGAGRHRHRSISP
jgi:hypothetical protein